ncbi:MAG: ribonuclease HII [Oscillospiraceae bacterium]|nr:ribonuclease HII [Oscillospiraceae bacterium]
MLVYESELYERGFGAIAGVDEAGRGPLCGSVFAAAVIFPRDFYCGEINDSKKLTEKKRERLFDIITENASAYSVKEIDAGTIDKINILRATHKAMCEAVDGLDIRPDFVIIDGNSISGMEIAHRTIVKGDEKSMSIAAASILAKVSRDREMIRLSEEYPEYNFAKNKGYGTKEHREALLKYGPCPIHRKTFLKKILGDTVPPIKETPV